jgi:hypothetical protein
MGGWYWPGVWPKPARADNARIAAVASDLTAAFRVKSVIRMTNLRLKKSVLFGGSVVLVKIGRQIRNKYEFSLFNCEYCQRSPGRIRRRWRRILPKRK